MSFDLRFVMMRSASIPEPSKQDGVPSIEWPPDVRGRVHGMSAVTAEMPEHAKNNPLSSREVDVLRLIAAGKSNTLIADQLSISVATVKSHIANIFAKLSANDRANAVAIGLTRGIFHL